MALTRRQREIYDYICEFVEKKGYSPSLEEIGGHFELASVATVHKHVQHLVSKGFLRKAWNRSRSLEPVREDVSDLPSIPLLGAVAAGYPIEAIEERGEYVRVPAQLMGRPDDTFALKVRGDSMIEDGIFDGDIVVCEHADAADNGQIVVALIDKSEATLKRFEKRSDGQVVLHPANERLEAMVFAPERVTVQGRYVGLLRTAW